MKFNVETLLRLQHFICEHYHNVRGGAPSGHRLTAHCGEFSLFNARGKVKQYRKVIISNTVSTIASPTKLENKNKMKCQLFREILDSSPLFEPPLTLTTS